MKLFYPVIHVVDVLKSIDNIKIAIDSNADGVFLISHKLPPNKFIRLADGIRIMFPEIWMGINVLDNDNEKILNKLPFGFDGYWSDNIFKNTDLIHSKVEKYFGGFAFKYQKEVVSIEDEVKDVLPFVDCLTTSGDATGFPPNIEKIKRIRNAVGTKPIAIASGICSANVESFQDADVFLVASSIGKSFTELDFVKTNELSKIIHRM